MKKQNAITALFPVAASAVLVGASSAPVWAETVVEFDEAELFFELNNTDEDLGIHAVIDGEPWRELEIEDLYEREILDIRLMRALRRQGLTELRFESAEPTFDEFSPERFFDRFREGEYEISGYPVGGGFELESVTFLSHVMPAPPVISVNSMPVPEDCDVDPGPMSADPPTISWNPVTESHPDLGAEGDIEVARYELVIEQPQGDHDLLFAVELPPTVTQVTLPAGLLIAGDVKVEVLVQEETSNRTATESCFQII